MTAICRTCRRPIKQVSDGRWGHVERAYFQPHYAKPMKVAAESEAEKREAWGNR